MPVAVITGASRGIGAAIVAELADTYHIVLAGRPCGELEELAQRYHGQIWPVDLAFPERIQTMMPSLDRVDVLIHCAGIIIPGDFAHNCLQDWQHTFAVNVFGPVQITHMLLEPLRACGGHIIFVNSTAGLHVSAQMASYSASKCALGALADSLRLSEPSLRISTIYPGRTDTAMQRQVVDSEQRPYHAEEFLRPTTVARMVAHIVRTPSDGCVCDLTIRPRP